MKRSCSHQKPDTKDYGPEPFIVNMKEAAKQNPYFRRTLWTGQHLQVTLMCIPAGGDIGLEQHHVDQYIRIEEGGGIAMMGDSETNLTYRKIVTDNDVIFVPAGTWHNIRNIGRFPLKLSSLYAPPEHPHGTLHQTRAIADADEHHY